MTNNLVSHYVVRPSECDYCSDPLAGDRIDIKFIANGCRDIGEIACGTEICTCAS